MGQFAAIAILSMGALFWSGVSVSATDLRISYYEISGTSHAELVRAVRHRGPRAGTAYGIAFIDFLPRYRTSRDDGLCRLGKVTVGLRVRMRLPKWDRKAGAPLAVTPHRVAFRACDRCA